jgi:LPXTG-site transpeptidase (sortase) family protein
VLVVAAILIGAVGAYRAWSQHEDNKDTQQPSQHSISAQGESPPNTKKPTPSEYETYSVPAANPRYIIIQKISVKAMIKSLGLTADSSIMAPSNVFDAGWYNKSALPGEKGAMVIDGHVSSWDSHGIFYDLKKLKPRDTITIQRGDGREFTYRVVRSATYDADKVDMNAVLSPVSGKPGLNLITCDGKVIRGTNEFDKRVVIFTELI